MSWKSLPFSPQSCQYLSVRALSCAGVSPSLFISCWTFCISPNRPSIFFLIASCCLTRSFNCVFVLTGFFPDCRPGLDWVAGQDSPSPLGHSGCQGFCYYPVPSFGQR